MNSLGRHFLAEFFDCDGDVLSDLSAIEGIMLEAAEVAAATVIKSFFHEFSPHGISGVVIIAESHLSIHTWPEYCYAAVDLFSCGELNSESALLYIKDRLDSGKHSISCIERGLQIP